MSLQSSLPICAVALAMIAATACARLDRPSLHEGEWREFSGTWNAVGARQTLDLGGGRASSVLQLKGPILLAGEGRPGVGFQAETIALTDTATGLVGRSVWTDENGDRVFSELTGTGTSSANRIEATVVGGTGRYAGITGTYSFSWKYVLEGEGGTVQGRAEHLSGRFTKGPETGARP